MSDLTIPTTETPITATYALLIGVDEYANLDDTTDAHDLKGSRNDVLLLARYCLTVLGMPIKNIRMLTSPRFEDEELKELVEALQHEVIVDPTKLKTASYGALESDVKSGVGWLLESTKEGDTALLSFSGHGSWSNTLGPVLCLGDTKRDTTGDVVNGVLPLRELQGRIERAGARPRLIAVLDCCHVTGPATHPRLQTTGIPHTGTPKDVKGDDKDFNVSDRVLLAAQPGELAHQMRLGMHWQGALTFALVTTAERWLATNGVSHGSYEQVWTRANEVITALDVPQTPRMVPAALTEIWKEPFLGVKAGETVPTPDAVGMSTQLQPDWIYTIYLDSISDTQVLAQVVITPNDTTCVMVQWEDGYQTILANRATEVWFLNPSQLGRLSFASTVFIQGQQLPHLVGGNPVVKMKSTVAHSAAFTSVSSLNATWRKPLPAPDGSRLFKCGTTGAAMYILLTSVNGSLGVQWYVTRDPASTPFDPAPDSKAPSGYTLSTDRTDALFGASSH